MASKKLQGIVVSDKMQKTVQGLRKKLSDLRFKFSSGKLKNVKEINISKKEIARILTIIKETKNV